MRDILFRGKTKTGKWVEGDYQSFPVFEGKCIVIGVWGDFAEYDIIPETVGQYTGLCDKNGTKIFEGDIVKADNGHVSQVIFWYGMFCLYCKCHNSRSNPIPCSIVEVIGNIHDNPELLKGGGSDA